jgi:hypothetical protein
VRDEVFSNVVDYAFGSGDRGLTLVGHDQKGRPSECRMSYYPEPVGWDVTSGQPVDMILPAELYAGTILTFDAVQRCFTCHTTNAFAALNRLGPEASDNAIGCERCHGPGETHVKLIAANKGVLPRDADLAIARPKLATASAIAGLCAGCHSPRDNDVKLSPGSPDAARFQGTTLTWSRCYTESGDRLSCVTCHNPHKNAEKKPEHYERRCLECHASSSAPEAQPDYGPKRADMATARSCPVSPARNCIECHMPKVKTPMAHSLFTDHFIRVHRADNLAEKPALSSTN